MTWSGSHACADNEVWTGLQSQHRHCRLAARHRLRTTYNSPDRTSRKGRHLVPQALSRSNTHNGRPARNVTVSHKHYPVRTNSRRTSHLSYKHYPVRTPTTDVPQGTSPCVAQRFSAGRSTSRFGAPEGRLILCARSQRHASAVTPPAPPAPLFQAAPPQPPSSEKDLQPVRPTRSIPPRPTAAQFP
jgi:hypothetical protein